MIARAGFLRVTTDESGLTPLTLFLFSPAFLFPRLL